LDQPPKSRKHGHTPTLPTRREVAWFIAFVAGAVAIGLGVSIAIFGLPTLPKAPTGEVAPPAARELIEISLSEFVIDASTTIVSPGSRIEFAVTNNGTTQHDFKVEGEQGTSRLEPGTGTRFEIGPIDGPITAWCTILGHRENGMEIVIQEG